MHPSEEHDQTIVNGIGRIGFMSGGKAARWVDEDMADVITRKAVAFVEDNKDRPFLLYFATHDIHVPRVPHRRFAGQTSMGPRGDAIVQFDWSTGEILKVLDKLKLNEKTLVILSSDNGPVVDDGYQDQAVEKLGGHRPAGPFRGGKYSAFEGGTRVPFLVCWPGRVRPGVSDALVCQVDLLASLSALLREKPDLTTAPDSLNVLPALLGDARTGRAHLVEQANVLSLRQGSWKFIEPGEGPKRLEATNTETGLAPTPQLYHLTADLGETQDLAGHEADRLRQFEKTMQEIRRKAPAK
jgi:arylsulfatase A-like enzyme